MHRKLLLIVGALTLCSAANSGHNSNSYQNCNSRSTCQACVYAGCGWSNGYCSTKTASYIGPHRDFQCPGSSFLEARAQMGVQNPIANAVGGNFPHLGISSAIQYPQAPWYPAPQGYPQQPYWQQSGQYNSYGYAPGVSNPVYNPPSFYPNPTNSGNMCSGYDSCNQCTKTIGCVWANSRCEISCNGDPMCANWPYQCPATHFNVPAHIGHPQGCWIYSSCQECTSHPEHNCVWAHGQCSNTCAGDQFCSFSPPQCTPSAFAPPANYGVHNTFTNGNHPSNGFYGSGTYPNPNMGGGTPNYNMYPNQNTYYGYNNLFSSLFGGTTNNLNNPFANLFGGQNTAAASGQDPASAISATTAVTDSSSTATATTTNPFNNLLGNPLNLMLLNSQRGSSVLGPMMMMGALGNGQLGALGGTDTQGSTNNILGTMAMLSLFREGDSDAPVTMTVGPPAPTRPQFVRATLSKQSDSEE